MDIKVAKWGVLLTMLTAVLIVVAGCSRAGAEPALPAQAGIQNWHQNGAAGRYVVPVIRGDAGAVAASTRGLVLTDSDCTPDAQGLSHCHNFIELENGDKIQIQNNHQMTVHRCLQPGEVVRVAPLHGKWIIVQTRS